MSARESMRAKMASVGIPPESGDIIFDVSKHAMQEASATLTRVCDTAPAELRLIVMASALASMMAMFRDVLPEHYAAALKISGDAANEGAVIRLGDGSGE